MMAELGVLGLCFALISSVLSIAQLRWPIGHARTYMYGIFTGLSVALFSLVGCFIVSDFSVFSVFMHSHTQKPMLYKVTGTWGHHEGSMLLWVWLLSLLGIGFAMRMKNTAFTRASLATLAVCLAGFIVFIMFTSNPFARIYPPPVEGKSLNPLLQDVGLAIHPPMLYLGYVGFGIVFAIAVGALISRRTIDSDLALILRPWALLAWSFLSIGIGLGSWWAYRELGWGGWWFWDPVENVSLLPWLSGTALVHCLMVLSRKPALQHWTMLLAIFTFTFSLLGTFLVRSGLLTSVHSFASDPTRGLYILAFVALLTGGALFLFARCIKPAAPPDFLPISREGFIMANNLLLSVLCATMLLGIIYPLLMDAFNYPAISVGAPYYNQMFIPLALPLLLLAGAGPLLSWGRVSWKAFRRPFSRALLTSLAMAALWPFLVGETWSVMAALGWVCGVWLLAATLVYGIRIIKRGWRFHDTAPMLTHTGVAVMVLAITLSTTLRVDSEFVIHEGEKKVFAGYEWVVKDTTRGRHENYMFQRANLTFTSPSGHIVQLAPEARFYPVRGMETAEAAIHSTWVRDLYATVHVQQPPSGAKPIAAMPPLMLKLHYIPAQNWLWIGFILLFSGGIMGVIHGFKQSPNH